MQPLYDVTSGSGTILLDDMDCTGSEYSLFRCRKKVGNINCGHSEDVGVSCAAGELSGEKGRYLTQSYDKSPYTIRK